MRDSADLDLLVCGPRGHTSLAGRLLGSASTWLVDAGRCGVPVISPGAELRPGTPFGLTTGAGG